MAYFASRCLFLALSIAASCSVFAATTPPSSSSSPPATPPWQASTFTAAAGANSYNAYLADLPHTTFAPGGRLLKVEAAQAAAATDPGSNLLIALKCGKNGMVLVSSMQRSPYLFDLQDATDDVKNKPYKPLWMIYHDNSDDDDDDGDWITAPFCRLSKHGLVGTTVGNVVDSHVARHAMQSLSESFDEEYALELHEPHALARRLADEWQVQTQTIRNGRILATSAVICSHKSLWRIEPTGQFFECAAVVAGKAATKAQNTLLERLAVRANSDNNKIESTRALENVLDQLSCDDAIQIAAECIRDTLKSTMTYAALTESLEKEASFPAIRMTGVVIQNGRIRKVKLAS